MERQCLSQANFQYGQGNSLLMNCQSQLKWNHVTISALWFSKLHPPKDVFMTPFVDEVKKIGVLSWSHAGTAVASTVHAVLACVDSPARASVRNSKQYNVYFGCNWCLQEGTPVGRTMKYLWNGEPAPERSHARVFNAMLRAGQLKNGIDVIKEPSALMKLRGLQLGSGGYPPDYMHCTMKYLWNGERGPERSHARVFNAML
ncbi:hypothetical protein HPB48_008501 [Haemaphysalis longicornis]|uniref:Uncharacterized protein n=1 Tax=Haemaphysalis longicornis TaxID=44386 RepID=A0A9J6GWB8_HAELO|nr:hypothetical protein HPB48_008501 [Haemaphysalis longicornis]